MIKLMISIMGPTEVGLVWLCQLETDPVTLSLFPIVAPEPLIHNPIKPFSIFSCTSLNSAHQHCRSFCHSVSDSFCFLTLFWCHWNCVEHKQQQIQTKILDRQKRLTYPHHQTTQARMDSIVYSIIYFINCN